MRWRRRTNPKEETATNGPLDPERESAQPQSTQLAALGALTTELIAARQTLKQLPTRGEVESRLAEERRDRRHSYRWLSAVVVLLTMASGLGLWQVHLTREEADDIKVISRDNNRLLQTIECVVKVASTVPPGQQQAAYGACLGNGGEE